MAPRDIELTVQDALPGVPESDSAPLIDSARQISTTVTYSCGGCDTRWPGVSRCHCAADGCHQTFSGFRLFDRHRRESKGVGYCLDPATIITKETGEREMYLTNGIWQSVENPTPRVAPKRA